MTIAITKAKELAAVLAKSAEYRTFQQSKSQVERNPACKKQLLEYRAKQMAAQRELVAGKKDERKLKELETLQRSLMANNLLKTYLTSEYQFSKLMFEIQKIIGDAVGLTEQ